MGWNSRAWQCEKFVNPPPAMPDYPIDLGTKSSCGPCCVPSPREDKEKTYYPSLYLSGKELNLPDSGEIILKFKKVSESTSTREGKSDYSCELEIHQIVSVKADAKKRASRDDSEDALDKLREEAEDGEND